jgi:serine/threonine protein kinase
MAVGGASTVYRAVDTRLGRPVAVKVLTSAEHEPDCADRFDAEASLHAALHHPGLVPLLDAGHADGRGFLVMPLVEGPTLAELVRTGPVDPREVRRIGAAVAEALAYVHSLDVVHRDVKPANVLLDRRGRVFLADFGAARAPGKPPLVPPGMVIGTAGYLAPEQALGEEVSPAVDVFALGLVLLEALTGKPEYTGTALERAAAAVNRPPRIPAGVGSDWGLLLRALTERVPDRRPASGAVRTMLRDGTPPPPRQLGWAGGSMARR